MAERFITRKVLGKRKVQVFVMENGVPVLKETREIEGRYSEKDIAKELKVSKVLCNPLEPEIEYYQMPVTEFMKYATKVEKEVEESQDESETADATETADSTTETKRPRKL